MAASLVVPSRGAGEDYAGVFEVDDAVVLVVADGAGGTGSGASAARTVVAAVQAASGELAAGRVHAAELLVRVDGELARSRGGGQTTAIVVVVNAGRVTGASVGDSEAWWLTGGPERPLTARQQRKPLLGTGEAFPVPFGVGRARGMLLLGSDGLFKYAPRDRIAAAAREGAPEEAVARLVDLVRMPGGELQDDVAVVLYRVV